MKRGDLVTVAVSGDYGKPRPALVIQDDAFADHPSVTFLPLTSMDIGAPLLRIPIDPQPANGLRRRSRVMVDKALTAPRERVGAVMGAVDAATLRAVSAAIALFFGLTTPKE